MRRLTPATGLLAVVVVSAAGYLALDIADVVPGPLTAAPPPAAPVVPTPVETAPALVEVEPPLVPLATGAALPSATGIEAQIAPILADPALGGSVGVDIRDGLTGHVIYTLDADTPRTPASATKLLTAAAVASSSDLLAPFTTSTRRGVEPDHVVLVAGGDTLLSPGAGDPEAVAGRAGLADLAALTAASLRETGTSSVRVYLDDTYAPGPPFAPGWAEGDI
ncbi:MAG: D-alanyl-D-alanine carboxypeptidase, partial [Mobilicoccus sp.]|nr:D-alanyl-D-alanine carboxypeptidase [Mobilicoccus sp.]